jgi:putative ABC transport system permease protein
VIVADDKVNFKITGVVSDFPKNSTFRADMLFPMSLLGSNMYANNKEGKNLENDFTQFNYNTFLLFKPGFSFDGFAGKA